MSFDYKKEYKEYYNPKTTPNIVNIPKMKFITYDGKGNPNELGGDYQKGVKLLYQIAYTLKTNKIFKDKVDYFDYVVPPLEGYWVQDQIKGFDITKKDLFIFTILIRVPDFFTLNDINRAKEIAAIKNKEDYSKVDFKEITEGYVVQAMHLGPYDEEINTVNKMHSFLENSSYSLDFSEERRHHEIYLSDPRKCNINKLKTIIRHPVIKK